jgi:ABC-type sugar transport system permease subunit
LSHSTAPAPRSLSGLLSRDRLFLLVFLVPILVIIGVFIYYPAIDTLGTSFTNESLRVRRPPEFVGIDNYTRLLGDPEFWDVTARSLMLVAMVLPLELLLALGAALLLNEHFPGRGLVRTIVLVPWLVPPVVNGFLWGWLLNGEYGAFNGFLYQLGLISDYHYWLADPTGQVVWVAVVQTWTRFAFPTIVLLAGLQGISPDLYDAAKVDGAGAWHRLRHITLPMLRASVAIVLVVEFIAAFQIFDVVWTLTSGASAGGTINPFTKTLVLFDYELVFRDLRIGVGAALSYLVLLMSLAIGVFFVVRLYNQGIQDR